MNFIFLMDPLETVKMEKDTSFILMLGAQRKGHRVYYLPHGGIILKNDKIFFHATEVFVQQVAAQPFVLKEKVVLASDEVDAVFIRTDPPFDAAYLLNTWLLERLPSHIPMINSPAGIRTVNEKLWATQFTSLIPRTLVTQNLEEILKFLKEEKEIILKPTDGFGGSSVFQIRQGDTNTNVIVETVTQRGDSYVIAQQYIPQAKQGDKRILLLDGEPLGAVLRLHAPDDHRNNFFSGGKPGPTEITPRDREIIAVLKPHLKKLGLFFVGIDIIGDYLIEVNVTSPTCLQEMNYFSGEHLEDKVMEFVENLVKHH